MGVTVPLPVVNLAEAKFECTFGRGCDGLCCRDGRPPIYPEEVAILTQNLARFLPHMRPEARAIAEKKGFLLPTRRRLGRRLLRVSQGWCIFFHKGCVLHKVGAAEGDKYRYKPALCALFPIQQDRHDRWYVRQKGFKREKWALFCLDPATTTTPAADSLRDEIALAQRYDDEEKKAENRQTDSPPS
ncbi:MAG TPA: DUF3109 family protein [Fimbriiglobus sp.]|jgi:hypothetical protein